jgi:hypothetical protein
MLYIYKMKSVGSLIKEIVEKRGMAHSAFARKINRSPQNVYDLFKRKTIDIDLLAEIGKVLDYDFFQHYRHKPVGESGLSVLERVPTDTMPVPVKPKSISIMIELDGTEAAEEKWVKMIKDINLVVRSSR